MKNNTFIILNITLVNMSITSTLPLERWFEMKDIDPSIAPGTWILK